MSTAQSIAELQRLIDKLRGVSLEQHNELVALLIENDAASARIFLQGAQLAHFQPNGHKPVLWLSPDCDYKAGASLRGGIPVCWPWFGDLEKNLPAVRDQISKRNTTPAHGLARQQIWQLDAVQSEPYATSLRLSLNQAEPSAMWPYLAKLQLDICIANTLQIKMTTLNLDQRTFSFSAALHSYFAVSDCQAIEIEGLHNSHYIDALDNWQNKTQQCVIKIDKETDRIYLDTPARIALHDPQWQRRIVLESRGSRSAVVWNPWSEKAKRLSCFPDHAYRDMMCIESANAYSDFVTLGAGQAHTLTLTMEVAVC